MMTDTFAKIEIMLLQKARRKVVENVLLALLLIVLAIIVYWRMA